MTYDFLLLDNHSDTPLYQQLYLTIQSAIKAGHLKKGDRLPSIRKLAEDLKLSCTTVETAYQQLSVEGYIQSRPQRGYFVLTSARDEAAGRKPVQISPHPSSRIEIRYNFGSDSVDSENIDIKVWRRHIREVLNRQEVIAAYGEHQGERALREALSAYSYGVRGVVAAPEQIVIGAGTQPLLSILCGLLSDTDRRVAMEEPGFLQAEQIFSDCGLTVLHLPCDENGIRMDALKESGVRLLFVSPSNRIQTGMSLPMSRRYELLSWAQETGAILIEDDYNGELRYNARPIPAMQGMGGEQIVYIGSFSKLLLPSVRIGYMALPPKLLERYRARANRYNQTASKIEQLALSSYVKSGQMERQLRRLRKLYAAKSTRLIKALKNAFGSRMEILLEETLLSVILTVKSENTAEELCDLAAKQGVAIRPVKDSNPPKVMLGFAGIPLSDIESAVGCLKSAWKFDR
ncbi:PLP-dependent aminotransferase family protein [Caproiciproducens galactitolivorans]|uniref:PLP-dependent aminotransferase family protein n=1 Tax=Caproiciproducens galactitolivorans TaxID=642589 RepID=A0ABT4BTB6_9FIRM|nr:PLP-dependent aminotransferase family protein [Caproiciproducens galactitolivorans]MCY1714132.1 PLP-dependent aminotransferase family protein [Caproiciproducens galactitolivorans]